jgi:hypothetical protein
MESLNSGAQKPGDDPLARPGVEVKGHAHRSWLLTTQTLARKTKSGNLEQWRRCQADGSENFGYKISAVVAPP